MSRAHLRMAMIIAVALVVALAVPALGKGSKGGGGGGGGGGGNKGGGGEPTATNNLSFPAIAVDGYSIAPLAAPTFTAPWDLTQYDTDADGDYEDGALGLTLAEINALVTGAPWYAQKTDNKWQADFEVRTVGTAEAVTYVDWSDSMETVYPKVGNPFRLEIVLFKRLPLDDLGVQTTMTAYNMGVLAYPSSLNELQGTNTTTTESDLATIISDKPKLVVQYLGDPDPAGLTWDATQWVVKDAEGVTVSIPPVDPVSFAVELNVGGKYIWGASVSGWVPDQNGYYRITFYEPAAYNGVDITVDTVTADAATNFALSAGTAAVGKLDADLNLAYIDVLVGGSGGGGGEGE